MTYLLVLAGCLLVTLPLELVLGIRVYRQWRRLLLTLLPVAVVFVLADALAVQAGWWRFNEHQLLGPQIGGLPVEELMFFLVVPVCSVLALEAVTLVRGRR